MKWLREIKYLWYYPTLMVILVLVGVFSTGYVYVKINAFEKQSLQKRSDTLAKALDPKFIENLSGSEADLADPDYVSLKKKLVAIKEANPDVRFVYLTGIKDGRIFFIVDSEEPGSEGYSPPGQIYSEASADFISIFETGNSILEGPVSDRWGSWISALSPLIDPGTQNVTAVVGMDIEAENYLKTVRLYSSLPLFITIVLLALVAIGWVIKKEEEKILAMKSEFVVLATHDIRSPLGKILWTIESAFVKPADNLTSEQKDALGYIEGGCRNLLGTINDYLLVASLEAKNIKRQEKKACNLSELIRRSATDLDAAAVQKSVSVEINVPADVSVECDTEKMKRVFGNVLDNAIKYSKNDSAVEVGYEKKKDLHVVLVRDHGIGVLPEDGKNVFRGFFRAQNAKDFSGLGTGLGLYYAKKVVDQHKGKIWFEPTEGGGTTFFIALK